MPSAYRLQSMQARLQDPVTGRFLSIDPVGFAETGLPGMVNRYSYTYNDPMNLIDPTGKQSEDMGMAHIMGRAMLTQEQRSAVQFSEAVSYTHLTLPTTPYV